MRRTLRSGFTLAEAAVTIAIVAIVLTMTLQSLEVAKITAAHTMFRKTARELGVEMLGEIESGRWQDELDSGASGTFADKDQPDYYWDVALGDEMFPDEPQLDPNDPYRPFDNVRYRADQREQNRSSSDTESEEEEEQPFEKVKLRVRYPKIRQLDSEMTLERWVRWAQIYGKEEEDEAADPNAAAGDTGGGSNAGGGNNAGGTSGNTGNADEGATK